MSQFGIMFFDDPVAAFTNIRRRLRPGARMTFACGQSRQKNRWLPPMMLARFAASGGAVPAPGGPPPPGPFAFANAAYVRGVLERAGFSGITNEEMQHESVVPEDSVYDRELLDITGVDPSSREEAWAAVMEVIGPRRLPDGNARLDLAAQLFSATVA